MPLPDINASVSINRKKTITDGNGHYEITQLASGIYTIKFEGEGYKTQIVKDWKVKVGTVSTLNVKQIQKCKTPQLI